MPIPYRTQFAFIALAGIALGSAITFGVERLNAPKPIIISDAEVSSPTMPATSPTGANSNIVILSGKGSGPTKSHRRSSGGSSLKGKKISSGTIDINTATLQQLEELPGVGPSTAQNIVKFRTESNGIQSVDELGDVPRMSAKKLAKLEPFVSF